MIEYSAYLPKEHFDELLSLVRESGYQLLAHRLVHEQLRLLPVSSVNELPRGLEDEQQPGHYRLHQADHSRYFACNTAMQTLKPLLFAAEEKLWATTEDDALAVRVLLPETPETAVLGARACDLAALALQDRHFLERDEPDPWYERRRTRLFIIAVDCARSGENCFCVSTGGSPECQQGFDLALTELDAGFLLRSGSHRGERLIKGFARLEKVKDSHCAQAHQQATQAKKQQRTIPAAEKLRHLPETRGHSRWQDIAGRCLSCASCTSVCPSCFCYSNRDVPSLDGKESLHSRQWGSCFADDHAWYAGRQDRPETKDRYQQWLMHKLAWWQEQYDSTGCTGCGRCISWCPAGIDFTLELEEILQSERGL